MKRARWAAAAAALALGAAGWVRCAGASGAAGAGPDRTAEVARKLGDFIEREMRDKDLPALSVALVDGDRTLWAKGFGFADPEAKVPAAADTVYRVGSVSKLFTDIAIMQRVEKGELDLDAPIQTILPDFRPKNPFGTSMTLRQLMSHRSGLVREPPVGHYFDATTLPRGDGLSLRPSSSSARHAQGFERLMGGGIRAERRSGKPFVEAVKRAVLDLIGMTSPAFAPVPALAGRLSRRRCGGRDGRRFPAPTRGDGPGRLALLDGRGPLGSSRCLRRRRGRPRAPRRRRSRKMTPPPSERPDTIGFRVRDLGRRVVGHNGAIYGFATSLAAMPDEKLGAVAVTTMDSSNAVTDRIVGEALRLMLAARAGRDLPAIGETEAVPPETERSLEGAWGSEGRPVLDVSAAGGELSMLERSGGEVARLRRKGDGLGTDGRLGYGTAIRYSAGALRVGDRPPLAKIETGAPPAPPSGSNKLVGEYGWDYDVLYVLEKDGQMSVLIEWFEYDALTPVSADVFRFPDRGLYDHETLTFAATPRGA